MTIKSAICPFCGNSQPIIVPTCGWYKCSGCKKKVQDAQCQIEDYVPQVPQIDAFKKALQRIDELESTVAILMDAVNNLQTETS